MRITKLAVVAAGLSLGVAACSSTGTSGSATPGVSGSAGASAGTSSGTPGSGSGGAGANGGVANSCIVGTWQSTGTSVAFDSNGAHGSATGGGGLLLTVGRDGRSVIDFTKMQPIAFDTSVSGAEIKGSFGYGGTASGTVQVDDGLATKGTWKPVGASDWRAMTVTVDLVSPVQSRIFDHVKVADFVTAGGGQTGGSVDLQPILAAATYECVGSTLKLGPPPGSVAGNWVLARVPA